MSMNIQSVVVAIFLSALVIFLTRVFPFAFFHGRNPPKAIEFIEKYVPQMIIAVLVVYCFKDVNFSSTQDFLPYVISCVVVVILHLSFKNSMISILGSTILFMILSRLM